MARKLFRQHKRNFTAGEVSDILSEKIDFSRYQNGCLEMLNMTAIPQGPSTRRSGTKHIYRLSALLGGDVTNVRPRMIPFVFSRTQAYCLLFFKHNNTKTRMCLVTKDGLVESSTPGVPYVFEFSGVMDIETFDWAQMNDVVKIAQSGRKPLDLSRTSHNSWTATEITFTDMPTGTTGWQDTGNWPRKVGFYEQRIVYASTAIRPQTLWYSRSADFEDFGVSSPIVDSDAVTLTFNSGSQNIIEWLSTGRQLIVGTLGDEWTVSGKGLEPLSFDSFLMNRHTRQGSEAIKPLMIGPVTIFVEQLGRTVNQFGYDYATDSYDVVDLSVLAPHLTEQNKIVDWTYQKTPNGIVWAVRDDGALLGLTMKREHNVVGWHKHTTDGKFLCVCSIPGDTETDLFCVVEREIDGETEWHIEVKAPQFYGGSAIDGRFLDDYLEYSGEATDTVSGLEHLEGKEVAILANGRPHPNRTVVDGEITLDRDFNYIVVGLPFTSRLNPTPGVSTMEDGVSKGLVGRVHSAVVAIKNSAGFKIGIKDGSGEERLTYVPQMNPSLADDVPIPLVTRTTRIDLPESSNNRDAVRSQSVVIQQDLPLPLTVLSITDNVYYSED